MNDKDFNINYSKWLKYLEQAKKPMKTITLVFKIPQINLDLYDAAAFSGLVGERPTTRKGFYIWHVGVECEPDDDTTASGFRYWRDVVSVDVKYIFRGTNVFDVIEDGFYETY